MSEANSGSHWISRIVEAFLGGNLSVLLIVISLICGAVALVLTPREEDPQIIVPIADVFVSMPGASAREVERQVATCLGKITLPNRWCRIRLLHQLPIASHGDRPLLCGGRSRTQLGETVQQDLFQYKLDSAGCNGVGSQAGRNR